MTKQAAQSFWNARYRQHLTWDEIWDRIGVKMSRQNIMKEFTKHGLKVPKKYRKPGHAPNTRLISDEDIVDKLSIDNHHDK